MNGRLALSPVMIIYTLSVSATGKGITHWPTDFANKGPIVGVVMSSVIVKRVLISK